MTVQELSQLSYMAQLLEREEAQVARLRASMGVRTAAHDFNGGHTRQRDRVGDTMPALLVAEERLAQCRERYGQELQKLTDWMNGVEDAHIRLILLLRFVDRLTWKEVAAGIGGRNTEDSVKKMCYRYLKANG